MMHMIGRVHVRRLVVIAALAVGWMLLAPTTVGGAMTLVAVDGHSMEPLLYSGDLAIALRPSSYEVGDLVVFSVGGAGLVIHRLVARSTDGTWRTQGDNKPGPDPWTVTEAQLKGRYLFGLPNAGKWLRGVQRQPLVIGGLAALFTLLLFSGRRGRFSPEGPRQPDHTDAWTIAVMCLLGGAGCLLLSMVLVRGGAPLASLLPLGLGVAGLVSAGLGVVLLSELLDAPVPVTAIEGD